MRNNTTKLLRGLEVIGATAVSTLVLAMLVPVDHASLSWYCTYAPYAVICLFGLGLTSLILKQERLMILAFLGAAFISISLRSSTMSTDEADLTEAVASVPKFKIAQFSTVNLSEFEDYGMEAIMTQNADVIAFQSLTPNWSSYLVKTLKAEYPHSYLFEDIGLQGIGLFSKKPFGSVDSILIAGITHVEACIPSNDVGQEDLRLLAVQTLPPVNGLAYQSLRAQLNVVATVVEGYEEPAIVVGDFNSVPWSDALYDFARDAELEDSRKNIQSAFIQGSPQLFEVPVEHIFYSPRIKCTNYSTIRRGDNYIGNGASFNNTPIEKDLAAI